MFLSRTQVTMPNFNNSAADSEIEVELIFHRRFCTLRPCDWGTTTITSGSWTNIDCNRLLQHQKARLTFFLLYGRPRRANDSSDLGLLQSVRFDLADSRLPFNILATFAFVRFHEIRDRQAGDFGPEYDCREKSSSHLRHDKPVAPRTR